MKKVSLILVGMLAISFVLVGCGSKTTNNSASMPTNKESNVVQNNESKSQQLSKEKTNVNQNAKSSNSQSNAIQSQKSIKGQSLSEADLQIANLKLNMTIDEIKKAINLNVKSTEPFNKIENFTFDDGTEVALVNGIVKKIIVSSPNYSTPRGLKVGDNIQKADDLYGKPFSSDGDPQSNILEYVYDLPSKNATFNVEYSLDKKIVSICIAIDADKW